MTWRSIAAECSAVWSVPAGGLGHSGGRKACRLLCFFRGVGAPRRGWGGGFGGDCATVCYMSETEHRPARVGVRELRQNLSVYLDRVKAGETLEVTEHGQPVAQLGPRPSKPVSIIDQMIAEGRITPATARPPEDPLPAIHPGSQRTDADSEILLEMRDEEYR